MFLFVTSNNIFLCSIVETVGEFRHVAKSVRGKRIPNFFFTKPDFMVSNCKSGNSGVESS